MSAIMPGQLRTTCPRVSVTQVRHQKLWPGVLQNGLAEPAHVGDKSSKERKQSGTDGKGVGDLPVVPSAASQGGNFISWHQVLSVIFQLLCVFKHCTALWSLQDERYFHQHFSGLFPIIGLVLTLPHPLI